VGQKPIDDPGQLPDDARSVIAAELEPGETVQATLSGARNAALVVTDHRIATWKDRALRSWGLAELTRVSLETGMILNYVGLNGPTIPEKKLSLGDIAAAPHAIQVTDKDRAKLVVETANRLISTGADSIDPSRGAGGVAGQGLEGAVLVAKGSGGRITLFEDRIKIKHEGVVGLTKGIYKGDKEIPIDQITAIQWRDPSAFVAGHIQFTIMGGSSDSKAGSLDENSLMFSGGDRTEFERLKREIEKRMAVFRQARLGQPAAPAPLQPDFADQIRKLAELRDAGILTEDEFRTKKAELLARM
jgi:hypothetical protein